MATHWAQTILARIFTVAKTHIEVCKVGYLVGVLANYDTVEGDGGGEMQSHGVASYAIQPMTDVAEIFVCQEIGIVWTLKNATTDRWNNPRSQVIRKLRVDAGQNLA